MAVSIRSARPEDATALAALSGQLGYPVPVDSLRENLRRLEEDTGHRVLVAVAGGEVAGWLHAREEWALESGGHAEIAGMAVDAARRNLGIGARLVGEAEAWARSRGHARLRVRSRVEREDAHRFYRRLGFRQTKVQVVLDKPLAGAAAG
jgi:GNAT superfamily N-acetyltransferase